MPRFIFRIIFLLSVVLCAGNAIAAECEHIITNNWGSGFQARIQITNTDTAPLTSWTLTWSYSDNTTVTSVWNADSTGTNPVTATSPSWFPALAPGATWSIGLNANGAGNGVTISGDICGAATQPTAKFRLAKTWVNGNSGDEITATTTGLLNNATISSVSTGGNTDTGTAVSVTVGESVTLPAEIFISGTASAYSVSDWVCDDAANSVIAAGGSLVFAKQDAGNAITCTLINKYVSPPAPTDLSCKHVVVNNWGSGFIGQIQITNTGTSTIDDWTAVWGYSDGTSVYNVWDAIGTGSNPVNATPPHWFNTLAPGATWNIGFAANGSGNLDSLSCSLVEVKSITLTLSKNLVNDNGGTAAASDWTLEANTAGGAAELSGTTGVTSSALTAGSYELSESGPAGYTQTRLDCNSGVLTGATLTLASGDNVTCTFYNDDQPVSLSLVKVVNNRVGSATANQWTLDASLGGSSILNGVTGTGAVSSNSLSAGDYVLSESGGPSAYLLESLNCDAGILDSSSNTLTLTNGENAICTFTNRDVVSDYTVTKSVDDDTPNVGDTINFTLEVVNLGPDPAKNVIINDILPPGLTFVAASMTGGDTQNQSAPNLEWMIGTLGVGTANKLTLQYQVTVIPP